MKQCPFCGAEIAENARFCLYCMARLTEATPVHATSKQNIRWWVLLAAVFVLCTALGGGALARRTAQTNDGKDTVTTIAATTATTTATKATESTTANNTTTADTTDASTTTATTTTAATTTAADTTATSTTTAATTTASTTTATTTTTTATTTSRTTAVTTTTGTTTTAFTQPTAPPPSGTPRVYWRAADTEDTAVITGFEHLPQGNVLRIPAEVDGKTVVGFDMRQAQGLAFDVPSVCQRITVLYLPPSIQRVPDNLFVHFVNLRDLYIGSNDFYMSPTALPAVSARTGNLTLHTPSGGRCAFANDTFAACCFSLYSASHDTWDPEEETP